MKKLYIGAVAALRAIARFLRSTKQSRGSNSRNLLKRCDGRCLATYWCCEKLLGSIGPGKCRYCRIDTGVDGTMG